MVEQEGLGDFYTEIENTYSYANRQAAMATLEMMYPARGVWIGVR